MYVPVVTDRSGVSESKLILHSLNTTNLNTVLSPEVQQN